MRSAWTKKRQSTTCASGIVPIRTKRTFIETGGCASNVVAGSALQTTTSGYKTSHSAVN